MRIPCLVTHLGSHLGYGAKTGLERIIKAVERSFQAANEHVTLLLENTAGTRNSLGESFNDIQYVMKRTAYSDKIGMCLDTCHAFAAGYNLRTEADVEEKIKAFDTSIELGKLKLIHLNDSLGDLNSRVDRHEHMGLGKIDEDGFKNILRSREKQTGVFAVNT